MTNLPLGSDINTVVYINSLLYLPLDKTVCRRYFLGTLEAGKEPLNALAIRWRYNMSMTAY